MRPLAGLRVVDLSVPWASGAARWLGEFGAAVERIDLCDARWRDAIGRADVLFDSLDAAAHVRFGDALDAAVAAHPTLVRVSVTGFGANGPRRDDAFSDLTLIAAGGLLHGCGAAGAAPARPAGRPAYHAAALHATVAALLGVARRRRSGRGVTIDVSAQEAVASTLEHVLVNHLADGRVARRQGALAWNGASFVVPCRDGHLLASVATAWETLVEWLDADGGAGDLVDPRWRDRALREREVGHIVQVLSRWSCTRPVEELFEIAQAMRLPWAPVRSAQQASRCPQLAARGFAGVPARFTVPTDGRLTLPPAPLADGAAPLRGLRVLDFSWVVAGPYATRILGDFGADVIKVQSARTGAGDPDPYTEAWNRNKRGLALDMTHPDARELVLRLVAQCDALVENFAPRVLENWGLDDATLHAANPRLVVLHLSAMGATGPWRDRVAFGPALQALAGLTHAGSADPAAPTGYGHAHADPVMGLFGALSLLAALESRAVDGRGVSIDVSGLEAAATLMRGPSAPEGAPEGVYRCRGDDRWCAISVADDEAWRRFAAVVGAAWTRADAYATGAARAAAAAELDAHVDAWTAERDADDVVRTLQRAGVAAAVVARADDLARDPHLAAREFLVEVAHPRRGRIRVERSPIRFHDDPGVRFSAAPRVGEHSTQVLRELLGLGAAAIERLHADGVLR